jgi:hypothetical protein
MARVLRKGRALTLLLALALSHDVMATRAGPPAKLRKDARAPADRLAHKILELSRRPHGMEELGASVEILASRLGNPKPVSSARTDWPLAPTDLIAQGEISWFYQGLLFDIVPAPSVNCALADLEGDLLDRPFHFEPTTEHAGIDSLAIRVTGTDFVFRVEAGELHLFVATSVRADVKDNAEAMGEGWDIAAGTKAGRATISSILLSPFVREQLWAKPQSLREFRTRQSKAAKVRAAKPAARTDESN